MRILVMLITLVMWPAPLVATDNSFRERSFVRALDLFDAAQTPEQYRQSAEEFESILADGFRNGAVYYNLGNAYFRAGEYGRAILNYRKAQAYLPRDPYLKANLQQAIAAAPGKLAIPPQPWWSHILFWTAWMSFPARVVMCGVALCGAPLVILIAVIASMPRLSWLAAALLAIGLIAGADVALNNAEAASKQRAVITGETIARKGTGYSYEPAFDQPLRDGAEFRVLNATADWTLGRFEGIGDGWVRNEFVAR